jgi:hypothetical protein
MANAFLSLLHGFGATNMASFGDSTGEFALQAAGGASATVGAEQR